MSHIHLVRHGRSAHVHAGWVDLAGFHRWRESYEAALWLAQLSREGAVVALTHATFRSLLAKTLVAEDWHSEKRPRDHHSSIWSFIK